MNGVFFHFTKRLSKKEIDTVINLQVNKTTNVVTRLNELKSLPMKLIMIETQIRLVLGSNMARMRLKSI